MSPFLQSLWPPNWQAGTYTGFKSKEVNQTGAGDAIKSRSRHKLKALYSTTRVLMATKLGRIG